MTRLGVVFNEEDSELLLELCIYSEQGVHDFLVQCIETMYVTLHPEWDRDEPEEESTR